MKENLWIVSYTLLFMLLLSCSDSEDGLSDGRSDVIVFHPSIVSTRAGVLLSNDGSNGTNLLNEIGVYAYHNGTSFFMGNHLGSQIVKRASLQSSWEYSPLLFWPGNGFLDFYAYAPTGNSERQEGPGAPDERGKRTLLLPGTLPVIDFIVDGYTEFQTDLLLAEPLRFQSKRDYVSFTMRHMLTRISFSARIDEELANFAPDVVVMVDRINVKNVHTHGTHTLDATDSWSLDLTNEAYKRNFLLERIPSSNIGDPELLNEVLGLQYKNISTKSGVLLMLPQKMELYKVLEVDYRIVVPGRDDAIRSYTISLGETSPDWQQGGAINYQLLLRNRQVVLSVFGLPGSP